ncbi:MAG: hypothetical protein K6B14_10795 [Lachnospiraceae bacterium]|nr:hypothetical protein [Lachnospiraceae bacterium]
MEVDQSQGIRSDSILMKKYRQYLLPSILTSLALALNEFVDSMILSNMLGSDALAIANMGYPIIFVIAACYVLLGNGGSTLYALYLGAWDTVRAGKVFRLSMYLAVLLGLAVVLFGWIFSGPFTTILCADEGLREAYTSYYHVMLFTAPILIVLLTCVCFLPPSGAPVYATIVNIVSNVLNLVMDVVFIKVLGFGVEGAAYATIVGYLVGAGLLIFYIISGKVNIKNEKIDVFDTSLTPLIVTQGAATALLQICYAFKYSVSNQLAVEYGGRTGVVGFSLCLQTFSIACVFLLGIADTAQPLLAMLAGQRDFKGQADVMKRSLQLQTLFSLILTAFFIVFPQAIIFAYGVDQPDMVELGIQGIRLFAFTYLPRGISIQFLRFFQVEGRRKYAFAVGLMDGLFVIPLGYFLADSFGTDGVYMSYPAAAILMFVIIFITNIIIYNNNRESFSNILLIRKDVGSISTINTTITDTNEDISAISEGMIDFCSENGLSAKQAMRVGLMCEEMAVYTQHHRRDTGDIDILLRVREKDIDISFRSIGEPFDPTHRTEDDSEENLMLLQTMTNRLSYDYIMGMNNTLIQIARQ